MSVQLRPGGRDCFSFFAFSASLTVNVYKYWEENGPVKRRNALKQANNCTPWSTGS